MGTTTTHLHCTTMSARDAARFSLCATPIATRFPLLPSPSPPACVRTRHSNQCASAACELPAAKQCNASEMRWSPHHGFVALRCVAKHSPARRGRARARDKRWASRCQERCATAATQLFHPLPNVFSSTIHPLSFNCDHTFVSKRMNVDRCGTGHTEEEQ